jgi:deoxyribodipyrimidine photo-lyase
MVDPARIHQYNSITPTVGPVVYWMQRDQRVDDNWALIYAQEQAVAVNQPLFVVFCLAPGFLGATIRQYGFMLKGLAEVEKRLKMLGLPFVLLRGDPVESLPFFLHVTMAGMLVTDFNPVKPVMQWKEQLTRVVKVAFHEVDAHNIVPCRYISTKQEYAAFTLRKKVSHHLDRFLTGFPGLLPQPGFRWNTPYTDIEWYKAILWPKNVVGPDGSIPVAEWLDVVQPEQGVETRTGDTKRNDWLEITEWLKVDSSVAEVDWLAPGEMSARDGLRNFVELRLERYATDRNFPDKPGQSDLSPWLHFGQISAQRVALEVRNSGADAASVGAYLEELIVRRELADNFCLHTENYDSFVAFQPWARATLDKHRSDRRDFFYTVEQFENGETHDDLWNAAQREMTSTGKMHGFMRMYWAKKILEWTASPEEAMAIAIYLNDKYELDGRDPNGYAGIAWAIGGTHDRPWGERPVFGMIRFMNYQGCKRKFDVKAYVGKNGKN